MQYDRSHFFKRLILLTWQTGSTLILTIFGKQWKFLLFTSVITEGEHCFVIVAIKKTILKKVFYMLPSGVRIHLGMPSITKDEKLFPSKQKIFTVAVPNYSTVCMAEVGLCICWRLNSDLLKYCKAITLYLILVWYSFIGIQTESLSPQPFPHQQ